MFDVGRSLHSLLQLYIFMRFNGIYPCQQRLRLNKRFVPFGLRVGVGHDSAAGLDVRFAGLYNNGSYHDIQARIAGQISKNFRIALSISRTVFHRNV